MPKYEEIEYLIGLEEGIVKINLFKSDLLIQEFYSINIVNNII